MTQRLVAMVWQNTSDFMVSYNDIEYIILDTCTIAAEICWKTDLCTHKPKSIKTQYKVITFPMYKLHLITIVNSVTILMHVLKTVDMGLCH